MGLLQMQVEEKYEEMSFLLSMYKGCKMQVYSLALGKRCYEKSNGKQSLLKGTDYQLQDKYY